MSELNPAGWLQNSGTTNTAQLMRIGAGSIVAGLNSGITPRGGVHPSLGGALAVSAGPGLSVNVASGVVYVPGNSDTVSQGVYPCANNSTVNLNLTTADGSNERIDLVVAQITDSFYIGGGVDDWELQVVDGTPDPSPIAPPVPESAFALAEVSVPALATTPGTITDRRAFVAAVGGTIIVRDSTELPSTGLYSGMPAFQQDTGSFLIWNGTAWVAAGNINGYQYWQTISFTTGGTFDKGDYLGLRAVRVQVWGAGASGGGVGATTGTEGAEGGGGGGGGYSEKWILATALSTSETITIGTGGAAASSGANNGNNGGNSSFGMHCSGNGGTAGNGEAGASNFAVADGGSGGTASGGDLNIFGDSGGNGTVLADPGSTIGRPLRSNHGGGSGGGGTLTTTSTGATNGSAGHFPGGGSSGARNTESQSARGSTAGANGLVLVHIYV